MAFSSPGRLRLKVPRIVADSLLPVFLIVVCTVVGTELYHDRQGLAESPPRTFPITRGEGRVQTVSDTELSLTPRGYVNDFAGVLNPATVARLTHLCTEVDQKANAQIAIVTVKNLGGDTAQNFAHRLFNKWGVGYKGTDRGIMVLLATDDRKYWTEVGKGLERILPNEKVGEFGRSMVPMLRQGNYDGAIEQNVRQIAAVIAQDGHFSLERSV